MLIFELVNLIQNCAFLGILAGVVGVGIWIYIVINRNPAIKAVIRFLWRFLGMLLRLIQRIGITKIENILSFFAEFPEKMQEIVTGAFNKVKDVVTGLPDTIKNKAVDPAINGVMTAVNVVKNNITGLPNTIKRNVIDPAITPLRSAIDGVGNTVTGLPNTIQNKVVTPLTTTITGLPNTIKNKIRDDVVNPAIDPLKTTVDGISSAVGSVETMVTGVKKGMTQVGSDITEAFNTFKL